MITIRNFFDFLELKKQYYGDEEIHFKHMYQSFKKYFKILFDQFSNQNIISLLNKDMSSSMSIS